VCWCIACGVCMTCRAFQPVKYFVLGPRCPVLRSHPPRFPPKSGSGRRNSKRGSDHVAVARSILKSSQSANLCGCYTALYCSTAAIVVNHFSNLCIMLMYGDNARPPITVDCLFILVDIFCDLCIMQMYCGTICAQATVVLCQPCGLLS